MSIKFVHIIFILFAILVAFLFGLWSWNNADVYSVYRTVSIFSFILALVLIIYGIKFYKKMKGL